MIGRLAAWLDARLGLARLVQGPLRKVFPSHWSFLLGEVALYSFLVLVLTGVYLTFFYEASSEEILYQGEYQPLVGVRMSRAYASTLELSFAVRAGLLVRQTHHWAAVVFIAAIIVHLARVFFTGAFRKPREINWMVGVTLLLLALANGFLGYSLADDLLSGTGVQIANAVLLSVPMIGEWLSLAVLGGEFPNPSTIPRFYTLHILLVPVTLGILISLHLAIIWYQKHTQYPGGGASEQRLEGVRLWPGYTAKTLGLLFLVAAVLTALGGLFQINPIWLHGPFRAFAVTNPVHPDWYMGWIEGALRIFPPWSITMFDRLVPQVFFPGVLLPGLSVVLLYLWPFLEARVTDDDAEHHLLDRPSEHPARTSFGVAALTFYGLLLLAASDDLISMGTGLPIESIILAFRAAVLIGPVLAGLFTFLLLKRR